MDNKKQVVSIEIAKRLKELGVKQESLFYWLYIPEKEIFDSKIKRRRIRKEGYRLLPYVKKKGTHNEIFAAFNVAELGEMLPRRIEVDDKLHPAHRLICEGQDTRWMVAYICVSCRGKLHYHYDEIEANARGQMMISLIESNFIKP